MTINIKMLLVFSVVAASCGQLLFKKGMSGFPNLQFDNGILHDVQQIIQIALSPFIISGAFFYFFATCLWLLALSKADLSYVYPFTLLTFLLVLVGSNVFFHEAFQLNRLAGAIIIALGVAVVSIK